MMFGAIAAQVRVLSATGMDAAVAFANDLAPEHLTLACVEHDRWFTRVSTAGSVFLGPYAPAAAGDYATGANHVLPTGGASPSFRALRGDPLGGTMQAQSPGPGGFHRARPPVGALAPAARPSP